MENLNLNDDISYSAAHSAETADVNFLLYLHTSSICDYYYSVNPSPYVRYIRVHVHLHVSYYICLSHRQSALIDKKYFNSRDKETLKRRKEERKTSLFLKKKKNTKYNNK